MTVGTVITVGSTAFLDLIAIATFIVIKSFIKFDLMLS